MSPIVVIIICVLVYFIVIKPMIRVKQEEEAKLLKDKQERIEKAKRLMREYPEGYVRCMLKHPSWTQEDFYFNSEKVIEEQKNHENSLKK